MQNHTGVTHSHLLECSHATTSPKEICITLEHMARKLSMRTFCISHRHWVGNRLYWNTSSWTEVIRRTTINAYSQSNVYLNWLLKITISLNFSDVFHLQITSLNISMIYSHGTCNNTSSKVNDISITLSHEMHKPMKPKNYSMSIKKR